LGLGVGPRLGKRGEDPGQIVAAEGPGTEEVVLDHKEEALNRGMHGVVVVVAGSNGEEVHGQDMMGAWSRALGHRGLHLFIQQRSRCFAQSMSRHEALGHRFFKYPLSYLARNRPDMVEADVRNLHLPQGNSGVVMQCKGLGEEGGHLHRGAVVIVVAAAAADLPSGAAQKVSWPPQHHLPPALSYFYHYEQTRHLLYKPWKDFPHRSLLSANYSVLPVR